MYKSICNIVLADDHPIMLRGLQNELRQIGYLKVKACKNGLEALELIRTTKQDLAILDIEMPIMNGYEVVEKCKSLRINIPFIFLSYHKEKSYLLAAKKIGVDAYMLKEDSIQQIDYCIQHVMRGNSYHSKSLDVHFFNGMEFALQNLELLTNSEIRILSFISKGLNSSRISERLSISKRTVEKHRSNIISKIQPKTDAFSLLNWAHENEHLIKNL